LSFTVLVVIRQPGRPEPSPFTGVFFGDVRFPASRAFLW
jgi:hypothetical protein